ncbi:MAG: hypothetical protein JXR25_09530 [Pontiellaceae bacterium]|nr:hypothetical protein [Pontiellaceae bacterium]MBN2785057.1 hypothetical protein [Pontiellaceae bacterium]
MKFRSVLCLCALVFTAFDGWSDEVVKPEGKTADYYRLLLKRPRPGYLFDRFCDSWLELYDVSALKEFLAAEPDPSARRLLAFLHERIREPVEAAALYEDLLAEFPDAQDLHFYKAAAEADAGWYDNARTGLQELLENENLDRELRINSLKLLGRCLLRLNRVDEGAAVWEQLLEVAGPDEDVADELLDLQLSEGLYEEALATCDQLLKETKDAYRKVMLIMRRASLLVRMDRRSEAVDGLIDAFRLTGQGGWLQRDVLDRIEVLFRGADDLAGMCGCYEAMRNTWPDNPVLLRAYTEALLACGKNTEALENARRLIRLVPDSREIKEWYVDMLMGLYRFDDAVEIVEGFLERYPDDNALRMQLAMIHHRNRDNDQVLTWVMDYLEHSGKTEADYLETARALARFDLNNEATSVFLEMLTQWPDSAEGLEAVALHMSRKSYLHLNLAWKHYEKLGAACDDETLLRLVSALMAARSPDRALILLDMRADDFANDYRFASARFDAIAATKEKEGLVDAGLARLDLSQTLDQIESATTALVYELKGNELLSEWIERLSAEEQISAPRRWLLTALYLQNRQQDMAEALLQEAVDKDPDNEQLLQCRLMLAKRIKDWTVAEAVLVRLAERDPSMQAMWIRELVPVLLRQDKHDEALAWIETWKKASPNAVRPYELERDSLMASDREDEAVERLRRASLRFPESKDLKLSLGRLYEQCGRILDAEQLYWRLLNAEESLAERMSLLGHIIRIKSGAGQLEDLIRELERRSESARTAPFPLLGLAECYRLNHRMNDRNRVLDRVLELRPNDLTVLRAKASLEEDLGNYDAERALLLRIAEEDITGEAYRRLVEFEYLYGDPAVAAEMMGDPRISNDPDAFLKLGARIADVGGLDPILKQSERMAGIYPDDYRFDFLQGLLLKNQGKLDAAYELFSKLSELDQERPGYVDPTNTVSGTSGMFQSGISSSMQNHSRQMEQWQLQYGACVPEDLLNMYSLATYRNSVRQMQQRSGSSTAQPVISIPENIEELQNMSRLQLFTVIQDMPEDRREELEEKIPYSAFCTIDESIQFGSDPWWNAVMERYPDSEDVHVFRLLIAPHTFNNEEEIKQTIEKISAEYPELVFGVVTRLGMNHPVLWEYLPGLVDRIGLDKDIANSLTQSSISALGTMSRTNAVYASLSRLFDKVETYWADSDQEPAEWLQMQMILARARLDEDYTGLIRRIEQDFLHPSNPFSLGIGRSSSYGGRNISYYYGLSQLSFPPNTLPEASLRSLSFNLNTPDLDQDVLLETLEAYDPDSLFRWLMLNRLGADQSIQDAAREQIEAKPEKDANENFALACWYGSRNQYEKAMEYLLKLREDTADDAIMSMTIDRLLASLFANKDEIPESLYPVLTELMPELKKTLWMDQSSRIQLIDLMEQLGLPLGDLVTPAPLGRNANVRNRSVNSYQRTPDIYSQVRTQVEQGDTGTALLRVAVMLRAEAMKSIYGSTRNQQYNHYLENCLQYIRQRRLEDDFLALMIPHGDAPSPRQQYEYAYALDRMGHMEEAVELYEKVCKARPDWIGSSIRYCCGLMSEDPEKARDMLVGFPQGHLNQLLQSFQDWWNNQTSTYEERLALIEVIVSLLEEDGQSAISQSYLLQNLQNSMDNRWYEQSSSQSRSQLPELYDDSEAGSLSADWELDASKVPEYMEYWRDPDLLEIQRQRRLNFIRLLKATCRQGTHYAPAAFRSLTAYYDFTGAEVDEDELFDLARGVIRSSYYGNSYNSSSSRKGEEQDALEYYIFTLREKNDWSDAEALLKEMNAEPMRSMLKTLVDIQSETSETRYLEILEEALTEQRQQSSWFEMVCRLHVLSGRPGDLSDLLWQAVDKKNEAQSWNECAFLVSAWIRGRIKAGESLDVKSTYERLLNTVLSEEERQMLADAEKESISYYNRQQLYNKLQQLAGAFRNVTLSATELSNVLRVLAPIDDKLQYPVFQQNISSRYGNHVPELDWIDEVGLLSEFDDYPFHLFSGGQQSMLWQIINRLQGNNGKPMLSELESRSEQTFGNKLFRALVDTSNSWEKRRVNVFAAIAPYSEQLLEDPACAALLFEWLHDTVLQNQSAPLADEFENEEDTTLLAPYAEWLARRTRTYLDSFDEIRFSRFVQNQYDIMRRTGESIATLAETDPDRAVELFFKLKERIQMGLTVSGNSMDMRSLLYSVFNYRGGSAAECRFILSIVSQLDDPDADQWFAESYSSQYFNKCMQRYQNPGMDSQVAALRAVKECITLFASVDTAQDSLVSFIRWFDYLNRDDYPILAAWLREQPFAETAVVKLTFSLLVPDDQMDQIHAYLEDENRSAEERLRIYTWLENRHGNNLKELNQPEFTIAMLDLVDESSSVRIPRQAYLNLLDHITGLEEGDERTHLVNRVLQLWRDQKVSGAPSDRNTLYRLVEFSHALGRDQDAVGMLSSASLNRLPQTYAKAVQLGYDEYVAQQLPRMVLNMENRFNDNETWIPVERLPMCDSIAEKITDDQIRLLVRLFFSRFALKSDSATEVDKERLYAALDEADAQIDRPRLLQWMIEQFNNGDSAGHIENIRIRFIESADMVSVLRRNNRNVTSIYSDRIKTLAKEHDIEAIRPFIETVWLRLDSRTALDIGNREIFTALFAVSDQDGDPRPEGWVETFLTPGEWPVAFQADAWAWLMDHKYTQPLLEDPSAWMVLLSAVEKDVPSRLPHPLFRKMLSGTIEMEAGAERSQLAQKLFRLWDIRKVNAGSGDTSILFPLSELSAMIGDRKRALDCLGDSSMTQRPQSCAIALRYGLDDYVIERMAKHLTDIHDGWSIAECWVPVETVSRYPDLVKGIDDPQLRMAASLFLSRLSIKDGDSVTPNRDTMTAAYKVVGEQLNDPELVKWVVSEFKDADPDHLLEPLLIRMVRDMDLVALLQKNRSSELRETGEYIREYLEQDTEARLLELLNRLQAELVPELCRSTQQRNLLMLILKAGAVSENEELRELTSVLARRMAEGQSSSGAPLQVEQTMLELGQILFASDTEHLKNVPVPSRMSAFTTVDHRVQDRVSETLQVRWNALQAEGLEAQDARFMARREMIEKWLVEAGEHGFLPLSETLYWYFNIHYFICSEKEQYVQYLHDLDSDALIADQLRAAASLSWPDRYPLDLYDYRAEDIARLLNRSDFDDVEKIRFIGMAVHEGHAELLSTVDARLPILTALCSDARMLNDYGDAVLQVFPVPENESETPFYRQIADQLLSGNDDAEDKLSRRVRLLSVLERHDDAARLLDRANNSDATMKSLQLDPKTMLVALQSGATDWCRAKLEGMTELQDDVRLECSRQLDAMLLEHELDLQDYLPQDAFSAVYFALRNGDESSRQEIIWTIQENPDLEKVFGIGVLAKYPLLQEEESALYQRIASRMMTDVDGDHLPEGITPAHIRALFALGREADARRLLSMEILQFDRSPAAFAAALEAGANDWCAENLKTLLRWNRQWDDPELPLDKLSRFIECIEDVDLKLAAEIFFADAATADLAARFTEHEFADPLLEVQARTILENAGLLDRVALDAAAVRWMALAGNGSKIEVSGWGPVERLALERYINGMLDSGDSITVVALYREFTGADYSADDTRWLSEIPAKRDAGLMDEICAGRRPVNTVRFSVLSTRQYYELMRALDDLNRKSPGLSDDIAHMILDTCYLDGKPEQFNKTKNRGTWSHERLFAGFTLLKGVQSGEPDEKKMEDCIADFGSAMKYYKKELPGGYLGRYNWYDMAAAILEAYPYSLDAGKWEPRVLELLPVELDPVRLKAFRTRRAERDN